MGNYENQEKWDVLSYSHRTVQQVAEQVQSLSDEWIKWKRSSRHDTESDDAFKDILDLTHNIGLTGSVINEETEIDIFIYLCTAFIYSGVICETFRGNKADTDLKFNDNVKKRAVLGTINSISKAINEDMKKYTFEDQFRDFAGHRASLRSPGSIPFMKVYTSEEFLVCLRRGIELKLDDLSSQSVLVKNASHKLVDLPHKTYHDGAPLSGYLQEKTLLDILPNKDFIHKYLKGKTITWIHVTLPGPNFPKTRYEIDFIDRKVKSTRDRDYYGNLLKIVGRARSDWKNEYVKEYLQEDIIVSFFSDILLSFWKDVLEIPGCADKNYRCCKTGEEGRNTCLWSELDKYSKNAMGKYVNSIVEEESLKTTNQNLCHKMYLGFDFQTILEGGYGAKTTVPGSLPIFLLALTRGSSKLVKNSGRAKYFMGIGMESKATEFVRRESQLMYFIHKSCERTYRSFIEGFKLRRREDYDTEERNEGVDGEEETFVGSMYDWTSADLIKMQNKKIDETIKKHNPIIVKINKLGRHPKFKSASANFITVGTKVPNLFLFIILLGAGLISMYAIIYGRRVRRMEEEEDMWLDYISGLIALISITVGVTFLTFKCIFKNWDLSDMIHSHRNTTSLSEMIQVLEGGKTEAVAVCSRIENANIVFSKWRSNSFVYDGGEGNFQIDTNVTVRELQLAGYIFGVDFQGNSIVSDCHGIIRQLHFFVNKDEFLKKERNEVFIGKKHPLQMKMFLKMPIKEMFTSSTELFYN